MIEGLPRQMASLEHALLILPSRRCSAAHSA